MLTETVVYFNHRLMVEESRDHQIADLSRASLETLVDLFTAQVGTVFAIYLDTKCVYRSSVLISDLI